MSLKVKASYRWWQIAQGRGLIKEGSSDDFNPSRIGLPYCGVSLAYLEAFLSSLNQVYDEYSELPRKTTAEAMQQLILPALLKAGNGTRLWDHIPMQHAGRPQWYVVHAWTGNLEEMVEALIEEMTPQSAAPEKFTQPNIKAGVMLWIDIFALDHNSGPKNSTEAATMVEQVQTVCGRGVAVALDKQCTALSRSWCLYEIWTALRLKGQTKIRLALRGDLTVDDIEQLQEQCTIIDIFKSTAGRPEDKKEVLSRVMVGGTSLELINKDVSEAMLHALHNRVKWGDRPEDAASLAVILLKRKEYFLLQMHLSSLPGLQKSDAEIVDEFKLIFEMYDTDCNGIIEEPELVAGLAEAGWSASDASSIFRSIDENGNSNISLDEFARWWESGDGSQIIEAMKLQQQNIFSMPALQSNLDAFIDFLDDHDLKTQLAVVKKERFALGAKKKTWMKLKRPVIKGDVTQALCTVADLADASDFKAACACLYDILIRNTELLDFYPGALQRPESATDSKQQEQLLGLYLANLSRLLKPQGPQFYMELDFATCLAAAFTPGWDHLPFMLGSGRIIKPSLVDLKGLTSGKEQPPDKLKLEKLFKSRDPQAYDRYKAAEGGTSGKVLSCHLPSLAELSLLLIKQGATDVAALVAGCELVAQAPLMPHPPGGGRGPVPRGASMRRSSMEPIPSSDFTESGSRSLNNRLSRAGSRRGTEQDDDLDLIPQLVPRGSGSIRRSSLVDMISTSMNGSLSRLGSRRATEVNGMDDIQHLSPMGLRRSSAIEMSLGSRSHRVTEQSDADLGFSGNSGKLSKLGGAQPRSSIRRLSTEPRRTSESPLGYADLENSESPFGSFNSSSSGGALRPTTSRPSFLGNMSRSLNSSNSLKAMADVVNGVNRSLNSSVSLKAMGDGAGRSLTTRRPSIGVLIPGQVLSRSQLEDPFSPSSDSPPPGGESPKSTRGVSFSAMKSSASIRRSSILASEVFVASPGSLAEGPQDGRGSLGGEGGQMSDSPGGKGTQGLQRASSFSGKAAISLGSAMDEAQIKGGLSPKAILPAGIMKKIAPSK